MVYMIQKSQKVRILELSGELNFFSNKNLVFLKLIYMRYLF